MDDFLGLGVGDKKTGLFVLATAQMLMELALYFVDFECQIVPVTEITHLGFKLNVMEHKYFLSDKQL